tara:strand:+ start:41161 stop:44607 length:3447 start_codon:yes stop_codon:yes gene_type:complete
MKLRKPKFSLSILLLSLAHLCFSQNWASNSVLSSGDWFKVSIESSGVYKLSPSFFANNNIGSSGQLNINEIRVYGNGQGVLPPNSSFFRKDDLKEIPLKRVDANQNGKFDGGDFILFFAHGPHLWNQISNSNDFKHVLNFYRDQNSYFISTENGQGAEITAANPNTGVPNNSITSYDDFQFKEDESDNLVGAGRTWVGDLFDFTLQYNYGFNFPDLDKSQEVKVRVSAVARASTSNTSMKVRIGSLPIDTLNFTAHGTSNGAPYVTRGRDVNGSIESSFQSNVDNFSVSLIYDNSQNPSGVAWLDFIEIQARRNLVWRSNSLRIRDVNSVGSGNISEFKISNATSNIEIWDITDLNQTFKIPTSLNGTELSFTVATDTLREFIAIAGSNFSEPVFNGKIENQNLHSIFSADMLIVSHINFKPAADRLADLHRDQDNMTVEVVTVDQVYNEFSSGGQDISAIRDFTKMVYDRSQGANKLKYLLLFGDASYDYRDRFTNNNNYVPIWQDPSNPFSLYNSSVTDDFYGMLGSNEGSNLGSNDIEIGIGRIPCESLGQAESYVDKIVHYTSSPKRFGDWRNKVLLMADDVDEGWESTFVRTSETLEARTKANSNSFVFEKIYSDAYRQLSTSGSQSYPEASDDMFRKVQQGSLVANYIGHGGEIGLSSEKLLKLSDVNSWTNFDAMPLFITITCEFTRFDDPKRVSAGEQLMLNPNGGAIGLISTTRVVDVHTATNLNSLVFDSLFALGPDQLPKRLGEIIKDSKNGLTGNSTRLKFSLFGDPAMRLAIPFNRVSTVAINGKPVNSGALDTIKALSKVVIDGQVNDFDDVKMSNFNGVLNVSVFDKPNSRQTLSNDGIGGPITFRLQNNLIYRGKVEVKDGDFRIEFLAPFDIAYQFGFGKISYYAQNGEVDAAGVYDTIVVGGFSDNAGEDNQGPLVNIYMNDQSFVRGGLTGPDPVLFAVLSDSSGINTVGNAVGHDIVAVIDDETDKSFVINDFYEADLNSYKSGTIRYPLFDLETGSHNLKLKVFDVYNNFTKAETDFIVAESAELALDRVLNYPNPFSSSTQFQFEHNRANQPLDVQVQIFTVSGKLVKTLNTSIVPSGNRVTGIVWDGLDDFGDKIGKGVYVYKLKVRSQSDNLQAERYEKLVILR